MPPLSGLQKDVLSLYRLVLRVGRSKDSYSYAREQFRTEASAVSRMDFKKVEYLLRKGHKHVKLMAMPGVKVVKGTNL
jgi:succinate dehydrogenase assembly factor 1